ncbi:hypothetical protein SAMN05216489_05869 [Streptomyces sp. 3213]|nr:hypothetical protein SAMN05216489_05869 [Streptomyces sp. 3213] [Streptomyces sp. 3213.3]
MLLTVHRHHLKLDVPQLRHLQQVLELTPQRRTPASGLRKDHSSSTKLISGAGSRSKTALRATRAAMNRSTSSEPYAGLRISSSPRAYSGVCNSPWTFRGS